MNVIASSTLPYLSKPFPEAIKRIDGLGFKGVEIYYEGKHSLPSKVLQEDLSIYSLKSYLHAPFSDLNIASFNETVLKESMRQIKSSLNVAAQLDAELVTIHFGRYSPLGLSYPEEAFERNLESVKKLTESAKELGVEIAFENSPNGFGVMVGSLEELMKVRNEAQVNITLDIGHANTWGIDVPDFIYGLNSSIRHLHIHDNTGESDMHLGMGDGKIDYTRTFEALKSINYNKGVCLEMLYAEDLEAGHRRVKGHLGVK